MLRRTLLEAGVADSAIAVVPDEREAVDAALRLARAGDLLLVFGDKISRCWKQIIYFRPEHAPVPPAPAPAHAAEPPPSEPEVVREHRDDLIRDERGVRLPREAED
jgi:cyanophycin synthetase